MILKSGLPYKIECMNDIKENGAIVDMSDIHYPSIDDDAIIRTTYIYLRNTDFNNITLDFQNTNYNFKKEFIKFYIFGDIEYNLPLMNETWMFIIGLYIGYTFDSKSILSVEEAKRFIKEEKESLDIILNFFFSLPLYPILRMNIENDSFNNDIEAIDEKILNDNTYNIIKHPYFNNIYDYNYTESPKNYTKIFTFENNQLFQIVAEYTPFTSLLYGMNDEMWTEFVDGVKNVIEGIENEENA